MKYPCENCKLRAAYDKNPKSLVGRFWRWQINFCPSWRGYFKSLQPEKQEELRKKYDFKKYQYFIFGRNMSKKIMIIDGGPRKNMNTADF